MIEPKIGEIFSLHGIKVKTCLMKDDEHCEDCAFAYLECKDIICYSISREDSTRVIFKEVEQTKIKPMEVKIQIPDNCELIKDGDTYIVKEKKQPPRSWEEFCERYPVTASEYYIVAGSCSSITLDKRVRNIVQDKNLCVSREEAEAFLALMQLRQLRKAWVGDWEQPKSRTCIAVIAYNVDDKKVVVDTGYYWSNLTLSFPTSEMAANFLNCFSDLCETAKILL